MVLAFCEDGVLELRGEGPIEGRSAIAAFIAGVGEPPAPAADAAPVRRIVRHSVTNVRFVSVEPTEARVESYFTVINEIGLDHLGRYPDALVPAGIGRASWRDRGCHHDLVSVGASILKQTK